MKRLTISSLQKLSHKNAVDKGFWSLVVDNGINTKLLLIISEVIEAGEEIRNGHQPAEIYFNEHKPEGFGVELADAMIRIADLAERYGIDLNELIRIKMAYNDTRPHLHGGKKS